MFYSHNYYDALEKVCKDLENLSLTIIYILYNFLTRKLKSLVKK